MGGERKFEKIWKEQCDAARNIAAEFGTEKAMGYLIGEKFLNFLKAAETHPEFRAEIPGFVAEIKDIFEPWQIREYLETPRRLGATGHTLSDEEYEVFRKADMSNEPGPAAETLMAFEWARELLLEGDASS